MVNTEAQISESLCFQFLLPIPLERIKIGELRVGQEVITSDSCRCGRNAYIINDVSEPKVDDGWVYYGLSLSCLNCELEHVRRINFSPNDV